MNKRTNTSVRLSPDADTLLKMLAQRLGISQTAIMELAIRAFAATNKVELPKDQQKGNEADD